MKEDISMRLKTIILLLAAVILFPGFAGAVSEKDFEVQTTENKAHDQAYEQGFAAG
jgi:hypothetical protein